MVCRRPCAGVAPTRSSRRSHRRPAASPRSPPPCAAGSQRGGDDVTVVRVGDASGGRDPRVVASLSDRSSTPSRGVRGRARAGRRRDRPARVRPLRRPGRRLVIDLLDAVEAPTIVVAHTVLRSPTPHQRTVLEAVVRRRRRGGRDDRGRATPPGRRVRRRPSEGRGDPARRRRHAARRRAIRRRRAATC